MSNQSAITIFIASWDENIGPVLVSKFPDPPPVMNIEELAVNIFMTFQTVFGEAADKGFQRSNLSLPFKARNLFSRILLDVIPNEKIRAGLQPFIVVALVSVDVLEETLQKFDPIMKIIAEEFKQSPTLSLVKHHEDLLSALKYAQQVDDFQVSLAAGYTLETAINDFKAAITSINNKQWSIAYPILKQSLAKFEEEKQEKLALEASYMLGTLLIQMKKYPAALNHFQALNSLASAKNEAKYQELFQFMLGFCHFRLNQDKEALEALGKIRIEESKFVNKLQYYSIMARAKVKVKQFDDAIIEFEKSLIIMNQMPANASLSQQIAQTLYEFGLLYYNYASEKVNAGSFEGGGDGKSKPDDLLLKSTEKLEKAALLWDQLSDYPQEISTYELIANIFHVLNKPDKEIEVLLISLDKAKSIKSELQQVRINTRIKKIQEEKGVQKESEPKKTVPDQPVKHEDLLEDLGTIAKASLQNAKALVKTKNYQEAANELIKCMNNFRKLRERQQEEVEALSLLIDIYTEKKDPEKIQYYKDQLKLTNELLQAQRPIYKTGLRILRELWIFNNAREEFFNFKLELQSEPALAAELMSTIKSFAVIPEENQQININQGKNNYIFYREANRSVYILGRSDPQESPSAALYILKEIYGRFGSAYKSALDEYNGDKSVFKGFAVILEELLVKMKPENP